MQRDVFGCGVNSMLGRHQSEHLFPRTWLEDSHVPLRYRKQISVAVHVTDRKIDVLSELIWSLLWWSLHTDDSLCWERERDV